MFKVIAIMIVLCFCLILVPPVLATSTLSEMDFYGYSYDELLDIQVKLNLEIQSRPEAGKITLDPGAYVVDKDIAPGEYVLRPISPESEYSQVATYEKEQYYTASKNTGTYGFTKTNDFVSKNSPFVRVELATGNVIRVDNTTITAEKVGNIVEKVAPEYTVPDGTTIPTGTYVVGDMIPAGSYTIHYNGDTTARFRIFEKMLYAKSDLFSDLDITLDAFNTAATITLQKGMVVKIEYGSIIMNKAEAFTFN